MISFEELSSKIGNDTMLVQGPGGNTSYKKDGVMWVKASGSWLANAERENIFVPVDYKKICNKIYNHDKDPVKGQVMGESTLRPSIETTMHALMPHKVVLHTHPIELLSWLILKDARSRLNEILIDISWVWIPYVRPGIELTMAVQKAIEGRQVDVILLGNHGLVVGGEDCQIAFDLMNKIVDRCRTIPRESGSEFDQEIEQLSDHFNMRLPRYNKIHSLALDNVAFNYCNNNSGVLYPDQAVFLGPIMPCYKGIIDQQEISNFLEKFSPANFLILMGKGVLISKDAKLDVEEMLRCHAEVLMRIGVNEKLNYLTLDEISRLLDWEPEKYRRKLSQ